MCIIILGGECVRINITISKKVLEIIDKAVKKHYEGNRSKFLSDAGLEYAEKLGKEKRDKHCESEDKK